MDDEERWRSLDATIQDMRGHAAALEMLFVEMFAGLIAPNPNRVAVTEELRDRMLRELAEAERNLWTEERATSQNDGPRIAAGAAGAIAGRLSARDPSRPVGDLRGPACADRPRYRRR